MEMLDKSTLNRTINEIFLKGAGTEERLDERTEDWREEYEISITKVQRVLKERKTRKAAPGPDGLPTKVWNVVPEVMLGIVAE